MDTQPQIHGVIRVPQSVLIDTLHMPFSDPGYPSLSLSNEVSDRYAPLFKDFHAHDLDASNSDYGSPSSDYAFRHSSPGTESPAGSPAAYIASLTTAPTILRDVDAGANNSLEAHRSAFVAGSYTRLRTPIHVKGIDV
jgi:hypothetical protein